MDFPSQFPTQYSQYQPNGAGEGVVTPPGTYGGHTTGSHWGTERPNVIAAASEQMLEQNGFYVRLQYNSMKQKEEIFALHEANSELKKEVELLKERSETYREIINGSITKDSDSQQTVSVQSKGACRVFSLSNPPPNPTLQVQEDHPDVFYWDIHEFRIEARHRAKQENKGETNGEANLVITKRKCGCPPKSATTGTNHCHFYLEYHDGTLVSREDLTLLSQKARMIWWELDDIGLTPPTFGQMTKIAWDFFWRCMVAYPEFQFLLLCKGGEWKLRQWPIKSYSGWAAIHGVREVKPKATGTLDDLDLIELDPEDKDIDTDGDNDNQVSAVVHPSIYKSVYYPRIVHLYQARQLQAPFMVLPNYPCLQSLTPHRVDPRSDPQGSPLHTSPTTSSMRPTDNATSPTNAPDANATRAPNSSPSDAALGQPPTPTIEGRGLDATTVAPAPSPAPVDIGNIDAMGEPSQPDTGGIHGNNANPRLMLDAAATTPSDAGPTPPSQNDPVDVDGTILPTTDTCPMNLGPEDANADASKKRKSSNNVPPLAPTKKQKSLGAPAIPTQTNSIRNICMQHWNQLQPGGQGTAAHFDAYYKALSDAEKEPFKKQMYIGRGATRKANAAANKGNAASTSS
ncbi:hypothetical protein EDB83DRAFT_2526801 [Lactarius deliciosus]|nr:hypothetical protein EDB83DRAFT_2526801 [Lactarius deliciosus]